MFKKAFSIIWILVIIVALAGGGFLVWQRYWAEEGNISIFEVEKMVAECKDAAGVDISGQARCANIIYTIAAIHMDEEVVCDRIEDTCKRCACREVIKFFSQKSERVKREIIGEKEQLFEKKTMLMKIERIFSNPGIEIIIDDKCRAVCSEEKFQPMDTPQDLQVIANMSEIRILAEVYRSDFESYQGIFCEVSNPFSMVCNNIKKIIGINPTIYTRSDGYCAYVELSGEGEYYCIDSSGVAGHTEINPSSDGYCVEGRSAICPQVK